VSLFTDWYGDTIDMVWIKHRVGEGDGVFGDDFFGATPATVAMHPIPALPGDETTPQFGVGGPWHERLPHFRLEFNPSAGEELQTEYFVSRDNALAAIRAIEPLRDHIAPLLLIAEIRTVAADEMWLSGAYGRDTVALHFTWRRDTAAVLPVVTQIEAVLAPYEARPHWGKVFTMAPEVVRSRYPRFDDFVALQAKYDPKGVFRNAFLNRYLS
jgi:alditol oxidase